jgi:hypothetical protein
MYGHKWTSNGKPANFFARPEQNGNCVIIIFADKLLVPAHLLGMHARFGEKARFLAWLVKFFWEMIDETSKRYLRKCKRQ